MSIVGAVALVLVLSAPAAAATPTMQTYEFFGASTAKFSPDNCIETGAEIIVERATTRSAGSTVTVASGRIWAYILDRCSGTFPNWQVLYDGVLSVDAFDIARDDRSASARVSGPVTDAVGGATVNVVGELQMGSADQFFADAHGFQPLCLDEQGEVVICAARHFAQANGTTLLTVSAGPISFIAEETVGTLSTIKALNADTPGSIPLPWVEE